MVDVEQIEIVKYADAHVRVWRYICGECETVYDDPSDATVCCKCPYCTEAIHDGKCE